MSAQTFSLTSVTVEIWEVSLIQFNKADGDVGYSIVSIYQMCLLQAIVLCLDFWGCLLLKQHMSQFTSLHVTVLHTIKCSDE